MVDSLLFRSRGSRSINFLCHEYENLIKSPAELMFRDPVSGGSGLVVSAGFKHGLYTSYTGFISHLAFVIKGVSNPLYQTIVDDPMRLQGMVLILKTSRDTTYIKLKTLVDYKHIPEQHFIICNKAVYEILDNFQFVKAIQRWKRVHNE